jgi:hypothetical protein
MTGNLFQLRINDRDSDINEKNEITRSIKFMGLYDEFLNRIDAGEELKINELTPEVLRILFIEEVKTDSMIAELFDVKPSKITNLRRKNGITIRNSIVDDLIKNIPRELQEKAKVELLSGDESISKIAKALTHFAFRNGPIESMHADKEKNITDEDMEILNKYMVNRLAYVFQLIKDEKWLELNFLVNSIGKLFGHSWDDAKPDDGGMDKLFLDSFNKYRN